MKDEKAYLSLISHPSSFHPIDHRFAAAEDFLTELGEFCEAFGAIAFLLGVADDDVLNL